MNTRASGLSTAIVTLLTAFASTVGTAAAADKAREYTISAQPLDQALRQFALSTGMDLLFPPELVAGRKSAVVKGTYRPEDALKQLLKDTGLQYSVSGNRVIITESSAFNTNEAALSTSALRLAQKTDSETVSDKSQSDSELKASDTNAIPEVLVKGSKIINVDLKRTQDDVQPYTILNAKTIEQSGAANLEELLKSRLTMNTTFATNGQAAGNLQGNTSAINLRGLGAAETLILVDGRRRAAFNTLSGDPGQPDINGIPLSSIERIEVLPSSASAIYGGVAMGGVINIILKRNFEGGDFSATYDNTTQSDTSQRTVNVTYGLPLWEGKTQLMVTGNYSDADALLLRDRMNLVGRGLSTVLRNSPSLLYSASNPFRGSTPNIASADADGSGNPLNLSLKDGTSLNSPITHITAGGAPGASLPSGLLNNAGTYNLNLPADATLFGQFGSFAGSPTTKSLMASVRQQFTSKLEGFMEFSTKSNATNTRNSASVGPLFVPVDAQNNPFSQNLFVNFPATSQSQRATDSLTQTVTTGLVAHFSENWSAEADYTWSKSAFDFLFNFVDVGALGAAVFRGDIDPFVDTTVHPLDITPYLITSTYGVSSTLNDLALRFSGTVGSLAGGKPMVTIGLEQRREGSDDGYLNNFFQNNSRTVLFGQSQAISSLYVEAQIPLVGAGNSASWIRSLDLQAAARSERYHVDIGTPYASIPASPFDPPQGEHQKIIYTSTNPTVGLKYRPIDSLIIRSSYARAFLPPTANQFFPSSTLQCGGAPCVTITDPQSGDTYSVAYSFGGNPNLKPQISKTWNVGMIWEPKQGIFQGLRTGIEHYQITQPNFITVPSFQQIVSDPTYASLVVRDPANNNRISSINDTYVNATTYKTAGWDLTLGYVVSTSHGAFALDAKATEVAYDKRQYAIGSALADYAGYPLEGGEAKYKANATLSWELDQWSLGWTTTYVDSYFQAYGSANSPYALQNGPLTQYTDAQGSYTIPHQTYHDFFGSYAFGSNPPGNLGSVAQNLLSNLTVQFGIKNVFNTLPPFDAALQPGFYSAYGDPRLRSYRLTIKKSF